METGQRALAGGSDEVPQDLAVMIADPQGARSYPIVTCTWLLLRRHHDNPAKTAVLMDMVRRALTEGQRYAETLRYVPLPENVAEAALAKLDASGSH